MRVISRKSVYITCAKCATVDMTVHPLIIGGVVHRDGHVGTSTQMRCPDCAGADGRATLCRSCCPTGHQTRWP